MIDSSVIARSPTAIAATYAAVGTVWVFGLDVLVYGTVDDPALMASLQMLKGWLFVVGSSVVLYALVSHGQRDLERTNERLDRALQQTSVLQRVLRHDLRNTCTVIRGNAELLAADLPDGERRDRLETIAVQTDRLVELSEKTDLLRDLVVEEPPAPRRIDLSALLARRVESARDRYPDATIRTDLPDGVVRETDHRLETAIDELLENAVEHDDTDDPLVEVTMRAEGDGPAVIAVSDTGPGLPETERVVFEDGVETPLAHSEGVGLWIARLIVARLGGTISIEDERPRGTTVRLTVPRSG